MANRTLQERQQDARTKLEQDEDVWVASASEDGTPHLVPFSLAWDGERVILTTETRNPTTRNVQRSGQVRLALGHTRDVVLIDAVGEVFPLNDAPAGVLDTFAKRADWDPREMTTGEWVVLVLRPQRILVWRDVAETKGRTVMRDGAWL
ncbi:pyridoxamine 5'-phosphate oxidase family protein [Lentzea sp. NPDC054927]